MRFQKCPTNEALLEHISIAKELSRVTRIKTALHLKVCGSCREATSELNRKWQSFFQQEPDITNSLMRVYAGLRSDETLVLKGWKLSDPRLTQAKRNRSSVSNWNWLGAGAASMAAGLAVFVAFQRSSPEMADVPNASARIHPVGRAAVPFAQIKTQDHNRVQVHYVKPELLQTIEFETTNQP